MAPAGPKRKQGSTSTLLWDLLTFDRLMTGPVIHLIYWAGLGVIIVAMLVLRRAMLAITLGTAVAIAVRAFL